MGRALIEDLLGVPQGCLLHGAVSYDSARDLFLITPGVAAHPSLRAAIAHRFQLNPDRIA